MNSISLAQAVKMVQNKYGDDVLRTIHEHEDATIIPTDLYEINKASNLGGVPLGRILEIFGKESSGKTSLAWQIGASLQRKTKKRILFMDYERSTSESYLRKLGVDVESIYFGLPKKASLEEGFDIMRTLLPTREFCLIVWDSLAAMVPKQEMAKVEEDGLGDQIVGVKAKAMAQALRTHLDIFRDTGTSSIFINHLIAKPAMNGRPVYGEPEETPGGNALKYYSDMRISLKPHGFVTTVVVGEDQKKKVTVKLGREVQVTFVKNKLADPFGTEIMVLRNGRGFDVVSSMIKRAIKEGHVISKSTGLHYLRSDETVQGRSYEKFYNLVISNNNLQQHLSDLLDGTSAKDGDALKFDSKTIDVTAADKELTVDDVEGAEIVTVEDSSSGMIEL